MHPKTGFASLPIELLEIIISELAIDEPRTFQRLGEEPSIRLLDNQHRPLKCLSLTCRLMRTLIFKSLFSYLRLRFYASGSWTHSGPKPHELLDGLNKLSVLLHLSRLTGRIRGLTFFFPYETRFTFPVVDKFLSIVRGEINLEFWSLSGRWPLHDEGLHMLQLKRPLQLAVANHKGAHQLRRGLFESRPWTEMKLNEGSSLLLHSSDNSCLERMPSDPAPLSFIRHLSYVRFFPLAKHRALLATTLSCLPQLVSLSTQYHPATYAKKLSLYDPEAAQVQMDTVNSYRLLAIDIRHYSVGTSLRTWTTTDEQLDFDEIVRPHLPEWKLTKPRVLEKLPWHSQTNMLEGKHVKICGPINSFYQTVG
ncbi:MAG: hypothetical protein Q9171_006419 [Xanthocarpia ochracea]